MKKLILSNPEYDVLKKVLQDNPPAKTKLNGVELYFYRSLLSRILQKDYRFPDTDDIPARDTEI